MTPEIREKLKLPAPGELTSRAPPTLRLALAPGVLLSPGGFGAAVSVDLGLDWMPSDHVGVSGFAAIPLTLPHLEGPQGSVNLSVLLAGAGVRFVFSAPASPWAPSADLGVMAVSLRSAGTANPGYLPGVSSAVTAVPFARVGAAFALTPLFRLRADVLVSVIGQGVSLQIASQEVATWGKPFVLCSAGVDFGWF